MLAERDFFNKNGLVKPKIFLICKPFNVDSMMSQICKKSAELEKIKDAPKTFREFIKKIDSDGNSHIWLVSDSANNQKCITRLIKNKELTVKDIPQGLINALIKQKVFTRTELE